MNNSEFRNVSTAFPDYSGSMTQIRNSVFDGVQTVATSADKEFRNCVFKNFESVLRSTSRISMYDSVVDGMKGNNRTATCLYAGRGTMYNVTVKNCHIALRSNWAGMNVDSCTFEKNDVAIRLNWDGTTVNVPRRSNFVDNLVNLEVPGSTDVNESLNYWGTNNKSVIAAKIKDVCDGFSQALATWWPYATRFVNVGISGFTVNNPNLISACTLAEAPSQSPMLMPTLNPTLTKSMFELFVLSPRNV